MFTGLETTFKAMSEMLMLLQFLVVWVEQLEIRYYSFAIMLLLSILKIDGLLLTSEIRLGFVYLIVVIGNLYSCIPSIGVLVALLLKCQAHCGLVCNVCRTC